MQHSVINANDLQILALIACCLLASPYIARFFKLPISATEIILGSVFAYLGLLGQSDTFDLVAKIGFYYLMFMAGMGVNLKSFFAMKKSLAKRSVLYISSLYILSSLFALFFNLSYIFIIILPVMSVGLLSILLKDFDKDCYWLKTSMIVATLAEVVSIVLLTIVGTVSKQGVTFLELFLNVLYLLVFLAFCLFAFKVLRILFWWYPQLRNILMPNEDKNEKDIRLCMSIFMLIIAAMLFTKLDLALGAFIAGAFISTFFTHKQDLEKRLSSFGYGLLIPIFFIHIGSTFDMRLLSDLVVMKNVAMIMLAMIFIRVVSAFVFYDKLGFKESVFLGLSQSMPLTLLVAVATLSYNAKIIDNGLYSALILTALFEGILVMTLFRFLHTK
ncbi:Na+/H+ exchanger family protein [Campylobacter avium LMG 24591]|uniref:Na+/H+ exchanger family protein n=1 Tax=Campylobacter avium LMG 24591 TaxID=522484 RepID=A0A222MZZ6_9BACT|nr:cation:proton antiporter [Campylobacter avium]ASQ31166.1 Na+/H+ exchanger family protein [Campylobacter avium LMG 24591]OYD78550.1 Na+/H+ exchanger family protein [Campylobacter avium]HJE65926.1 cation:proton antiporter [Campylobacter avium]